MTEPLEFQRENGTRNIRIKFRGEWIGLGTIGTTSFGTGMDTSDANQEAVASASEEYGELTERSIALLLAAPQLLEALEQIALIGVDPRLKVDAIDARGAGNIARAALKAAS